MSSKLIFDIDGVLINTDSSYREAIKKSVEFFIKAEVSYEKIDYIKSQPGFNNDWYAAYVLVNSILLGIDIQKFCLADQPGGIAEIISFEQIKDVFQSYYLGPDRYFCNQVKPERGLWETEDLILDKEKLAELSKKHGPLTIITGRTEEEARYSLEYFDILQFFDKIISVEAIKNFDFKKYPEYKKFGQDKSNPVILKQIGDLESFQNSYYIGDTVNDVMLVKNAALYKNLKSILFSEVEDINRSKSEDFGADFFICGSSNLFQFLINL